MTEQEIASMEQVEAPDAIKQLCDQLLQACPNCAVKITNPLQDDGFWWLDVHWTNSESVAGHASIAWAADVGFGVSSGEKFYGEGFDAVFVTQNEVIPWLASVRG